MTEIVNALPVIISLVIMEGLLSVDNAMVIAAMVSHLPDKQRNQALRVGFAGAYIFRAIALFFAATLIAYPWIRLLGAGYLVYLMCKNLGIDGEESSGHKKLESGFWGTIFGIGLVDLAFSIDNVIAAVALSRELWVVMAGVFIGIAAMRFVAGFFVNMMKKYPILESIAYLLVGYVGVQLMLEELVHFHVSEVYKFSAIVGIIGAGMLYSWSPLLQRLLRPFVFVLGKLMGFVAKIVDLILWPFIAIAKLIAKPFIAIFKK